MRLRGRTVMRIVIDAEETPLTEYREREAE